MARRIPILTFHAIEERPGVIGFPPSALRRALRHLREKGHRSIRLSEVAALLASGQAFPDRSFVITFDDGYRNVYEAAFPILQELGLTATVFLTVGPSGAEASPQRFPPLGGRPMLSWAEVREMAAAGLEFGAHTLTHPDLKRLSPDQAETEIAESKKRIEDALGTPVEGFAYPFGRYDPVSVEIVRGLFHCACSDRLGLVTTGSDRWLLPRVDAYYLRSLLVFALTATPWLGAYLALRNIPRQMRRRLASRVE